MGKNKRAAHAICTYMNKSVPSSARQQREITTFTVLMTTWAYNHNLSVFNDLTERTPNQLKCTLPILQNANMQDGTIANIHNWAGVYFQVTFSLPLPWSLLKFPSNTSHHCCCKWNIVYERWYQGRNPYNKDHCDAQFTLIGKWRKMWYVRGLKYKTKQNLSVNHVRKKLMTPFHQV